MLITMLNLNPAFGLYMKKDCTFAAIKFFLMEGFEGRIVGEFKSSKLLL
jgi:hypothetical protein